MSFIFRRRGLSWRDFLGLCTNGLGKLFSWFFSWFWFSLGMVFILWGKGVLVGFFSVERIVVFLEGNCYIGRMGLLL